MFKRIFFCILLPGSLLLMPFLLRPAEEKATAKAQYLQDPARLLTAVPYPHNRQTKPTTVAVELILFYAYRYIIFNTFP